MVAMLVAKSGKWPSDIVARTHGEQQFTLASLLYEAEQQKRAIELARQKGNLPDPPKIITARS